MYKVYSRIPAYGLFPPPETYYSKDFYAVLFDIYAILTDEIQKKLDLG